ncbi:CdaR family protein [Hallella sp.]|uniref:CdaR family protein n=1 Tax=Hallella sp. TaxID=2980186 RepID=UPI00307D70FC
MHKLQRTFQVVRSSLFSWMNKEFLIFLFFLVLSGIFWLMMTLNETYEKELPVAVRLTGAPGNVVMTSEMSDTVRVTVRDKGFMILSYMSSNKLKPITLNFNAYANKQSGHGQVPLSDVQRLVRQQLFSSSTITSIKADALTFNFNYGERKTVGVKLIGNIVPTRNYYLSHVQLTPEKVTIFASRSKLDSIKEVQTEYVNITNFDDTVRQMVRIKKIPGVKVVPEKVKMTLFVDILTEESINVPITTINKPGDLTIRTFPNHVKVTFSVGSRLFRRVKASDFQVVIDYNEVAAHPSDKCKLHLRAKPSIVSNARLDMTQVDYLIEQQ